ncbi:MAG TPA: hypothetical protein ENK11_08165, partial [Phycisphaerales bacterium]|nr:hypothetical protein [Phycisphaerales bacterium]
ARRIAANTEFSRSYRRDTIGTWKRFLAWCCEELVIEAETVDRFAYVRLRYPPQSSPSPSILSGSRSTSRPGRPPRAVSRTAPDPRRFPDDFFAVVREALPLLAPDLRDIVRLLLLTGARPGELLRLTTFAIDTTSLPWFAVLEEHKTVDHTDEPRYIVFNKAARIILDRHIRPFCPHDFIFPAPKNPEKHIARDLVQKRLRKTLLRNKLPTWTLYDARRWAATVARGSEGLEAAQALLGHSRASTTEIYAPPQLTDAIRAARALDRRVQP